MYILFDRDKLTKNILLEDENEKYGGGMRKNIEYEFFVR